jgi:hypothetical protein
MELSLGGNDVASGVKKFCQAGWGLSVEESSSRYLACWPRTYLWGGVGEWGREREREREYWILDRL